MTETEEQTEVDVDLDLEVPCTLKEECAEPAAFRLRFTCGHHENGCYTHTRVVLGEFRSVGYCLIDKPHRTKLLDVHPI